MNHMHAPAQYVPGFRRSARRSLGIATLTALVLGAVLAPRASAQTYVLTDLGPGGALGISPDGEVTGYTITPTSTSAANTDDIFAWTPTSPNGSGGTYHDLGLVGTGFGINSSGQVAAQSFTYSKSTRTFIPNAYLYSGGQWKALSGSTPPSGAFAINGSGSVTGFATTASKGNYHQAAALWQGGKQYSLSPLVTNYTNYSAYAYGINDYGEVTGAAVTPGWLAFLWIPAVQGGTSGSYENFAGSGWTEGINRYGELVGAASNDAFLWTPTSLYGASGAAAYIANPYADVSDTEPRSVNASDQVVGNYYTTTGFYHGFLWDSASGILRDLNDPTYVTVLGIPSGQTWVFSCPNRIAGGPPSIPAIANNDAGQICGEATVTDSTGASQEHAFLLTPQ